MAVIPSYEAIGIAAPVTVLLARLIQGFSVGGEFGSATAYLVEHSKNRKGFMASWQWASQGLTALVASAHNLEVRSYPWRFASVISVASHDGDDPLEFLFNPEPPVEILARGMDLEVAWLGGGRILAAGNSFATAHVTGICALILAKHPALTPFELKTVLRETATNIRTA